MKGRRKLLIAIGAGTLAAPLAVFAQQKGKLRRIGFLVATTASGHARLVEAFRSGLRELGYVEGKNIAIEYRWAEEHYERLPRLAAELVRSGAEVIVTHGAPGTRAAKQATATIPIVMAIVGDPEATGIVASLARPGGNVTGSSFFTLETQAKRVEVLREAIPRIARIGVILNPENPTTRLILESMELTARSLKVVLTPLEMQGPDDFSRVFSDISKWKIDAAVRLDDAILVANGRRLAEMAAQHKLPLIASTDSAEDGALMGYGVNRAELYRRAALLVDKILKGAKPGDLPIERATKFELVVNMRTAKALGLTIPQSVLVRADRVIE